MHVDENSRATFDPDSLAARDERMIRAALPLLRGFATHYVRLRVEGLEHVKPGPALFVANHNGGICGPDLPCTLLALWSALGPDAPLYALAHDFAMRQFTPLGRVLQRFGALRACRENALKVLRQGGQLLVYPGGDVDAYRRFSRRHEVVFGDRLGFVHVARESGVPIVPIVASGAHSSAMILSEGEGLARALELKRWARLERFPIALALPWGIALGPWLPYLPLPFAIRLRFLPAMDVVADASPAEAQRRVHAAMQRALDELRRQVP